MADTPVQGSLTSEDLKVMSSNDYIVAGATIAGSLTSADLKDKNGNYYHEYNFASLDSFTQLTFNLTRPTGTNGVTYLSLINSAVGSVIAEGNNSISNGQTTTSFATTIFPGGNYKIRISNTDVGGYTLSAVDEGKATSIISNLPKSSLVGYFDVGTVGASGKYFPMAGGAGRYTMTDLALAPNGEFYGIGPSPNAAQSYLYRIDPNSYQGNQIGYASSTLQTIKDSQGNPLIGNINSLGFTTDNRLYAIDTTATEDRLYTIDTNSQVATLIGNLPTGFKSGGDLTYDAAHSSFFATSLATALDTNKTDWLWQIPTANPTGATKIGQIGFSGVVGLDFENGQLTGFNNSADGTSSNKISINNTNGVGTLIQQISGISGISGATTVPSPKPTRNDFNGDGKADILWRNDSGAVNIWTMNGAAVTATNLTSTATLANSWKTAGIGDFNGDGKSDILWRNDNGAVALWQMDGSSVVSSSLTSTTTLANSWKVAGTGDFNGDGKSDILWRNDDGSVALWQMNGSSVVSSSLTSTTTLANSWKVAGTGDFNGDGKSDILWRNDDGSVALWQMNGSSVVSSSLTSTPFLDSSWKINGTADFNGDGKSDILWRNNNGAVALWQMDGATVVSSSLTSTPSLDSSWKINETADFNGDGKADILWRKDSGSVAVWQMNGAAVVSSNLTSTQSPDNAAWKIAPSIL